MRLKFIVVAQELADNKEVIQVKFRMQPGAHYIWLNFSVKDAQKYPVGKELYFREEN